MKLGFAILLLGCLLLPSFAFSVNKVWTGSSSIYWGINANWSPSGIPTISDNVTIPSSPIGGRMPTFDGYEGNRKCASLTIESGALFSYTTSTSTSFLSINGNLTVEGTWYQSGTVGFDIDGGTSGSPRFISTPGSGDISSIWLKIGTASASYIKFNSDVDIEMIWLDVNYNSVFDMNNYNLRTLYFFIDGGTFYQRSGVLYLEGFDATNYIIISNASFNEGSGTTYFSRGLSGFWGGGGTQTVPSITYYNLKIRTTSGNTATLGSGSTVTISNNLEIVTGSSGGTVSMANNHVNVSGNFSIASGSTLNTNGSNSKTLTIGGTSITNTGSITGFSSGGNYEMIATNSVDLSGSGTWAIEAQFQKNLTIGAYTVTINDGYFRLGNSHGWFVTNNGTVTGSTAYYHMYLDKDYNISGSGTYARINVGLGDKATATLGADLLMTGNLMINDNQPDAILSNGHDISLGGSFINNGSFTAGSEKVTFNGSAAATIEGSAITSFYDLEISKTATGNTVTNASGQKAFQVGNDLTVTTGTLAMGAIDAHYVVTGDLTVSANGVLNHSTDWSNSKYLNAQEDVDILGTYSPSGNNPMVYCSGSGTRYIRCPNSSFEYLTFTTGNFYANGNITVNENLWAMWNSASGELHTNGNTITANNGVYMDGGKVYVDGGALTVTGPVNVGVSDRNAELVVSSGTLTCDDLNNGDGTRLGTITFSGGTIDVNDDLTLNSSTTFSTSNNPNLYLGGDWVNKGGSYTPAQTETYFDGVTEQKINVIADGGTTPYDSDFNFYNVTVSNAHANGAKVYYKKATNRLVNFNNVVINNGAKLSVVGN